MLCYSFHCQYTIYRCKIQWANFWSCINSHSNHLADTSFIPNSSLKMWYAHSDDIPTVSNFSHFQLANLQDHFVHFCKIYGVVTQLQWLLHWLSSKLSRPHLNLFIHFATVEYEGAESPSVFLKIGMNLICSHTFLYKVLDHRSNVSFFSIFTNHYTGTTDRGRHHNSAPRALTCHVFTAKGWFIIMREQVVLEPTSGGDSENFSNYPRIQVISGDWRGHHSIIYSVNYSV